MYGNLQCGPSATDTAWHVIEIENDKAVVVRCIARDTDTVTTSPRSNTLILDADIDHSFSCHDQVL